MNETQNHRPKQPNLAEFFGEELWKEYDDKELGSDIIDAAEFGSWKVGRCTRFVIGELSKHRAKLLKSAEISANDGDSDKSKNILIRTSEISRIINLITNQKYELE